MKLIEMLEPDFSFEDERGSLVQLVREGYRQLNVICSKKGSFRGGHYHKLTKEAFYVIEGSFLLEAEKDGVKEAKTFSAGDMFLINEYIVHSFDYLEDTILVSMYNNGVEYGDEKDIVNAK